MSRKADMQAVFKGELPNLIPTWELDFYLYGKFSEKPYVVGAPFIKLTRAERDRQLGLNAEIMCEVGRALGFSGITVPAWYWEAAPGHPAYSWLPEEDRETLFKRLVALGGDDFFFVVHTGGVIGMPPAHIYEDFCCDLIEAPEAIDTIVAERLQQGLEAAERWAELGADGFLMPADLAMNSGPFYSPPQMERFIFPSLRAMAEKIRSLGGYSILHTDGNITDLLAGIAASGVDALQALDPIAGMRLDKVKALVGDSLVLCGNVDCCTLLAGTPAKVAEETALCIEQGKPGGRYVLGSSNVIEPEGPRENFASMVETWRKDPGYGESPIV